MAPQIATEQETPEEAARRVAEAMEMQRRFDDVRQAPGDQGRAAARIRSSQAKETAFAIERRKEALEARLKRSNEPAIRKRRAMEQLEELEEQHDRAFRILNPIAHGSPFGRAPGEPREPEMRMVECRCGRTLPSRERYQLRALFGVQDGRRSRRGEAPAGLLSDEERQAMSKYGQSRCGRRRRPGGREEASHGRADRPGVLRPDQGQGYEVPADPYEQVRQMVAEET